MASRIAHVGSNLRTRVRAAVQRNDASFMHHFLHDGHIAAALHDLLSIAIDHREYGPGNAACNAPDVRAEILPGVGFGIIVQRGFAYGPGSGLWKQCGRLAIRRINH